MADGSENKPVDLTSDSKKKSTTKLSNDKQDQAKLDAWKEDLVYEPQAAKVIIDKSIETPRSAPASPRADDKTQAKLDEWEKFKNSSLDSERKLSNSYNDTLQSLRTHSNLDAKHNQLRETLDKTDATAVNKMKAEYEKQMAGYKSPEPRAKAQEKGALTKSSDSSANDEDSKVGKHAKKVKRKHKSHSTSKSHDGGSRKSGSFVTKVFGERSNKDKGSSRTH